MLLIYFPVYTKPHHGLMLISYKSSLGHHELMVRFCGDKCFSLYVEIFVTIGTLPRISTLSLESETEVPST